MFWDFPPKFAFLVPAEHDFQKSEKVVGGIRKCDRVLDSVFIGYFSDGPFTFSGIKFSMERAKISSHLGNINMKSLDFQNPKLLPAGLQSLSSPTPPENRIFGAPGSKSFVVHI